MKTINLRSYSRNFLLSLGGISLSACSTLGAVGDTISDINPFDRSEEAARAAQGEVAGQDERISLLSVDDQLQVTEDGSAGPVIIPQAYVNESWPNTGGSLTHAMQHLQARGPLERSWQKDIGKGTNRKGRIIAQPIIANNKVFVVDSNNKVSAYDANTGQSSWSYDVEVELQSRTREGRSSWIERITNPASLRDTGGQDRESVGGGLAFDRNILVVTSGLGVVVALDATTGSELWTKKIAAPMHSSPTISNGRIFAITDENELIAFNLDTGNVLWTYRAIDEMARMLTSSSPAVVDDVVIAPFTSGEIVALRVQNGGVLWQDALTSSGRLTPLSTLNDISAGPVIADGFVIASSQSGVMSALDFRTGQRIWTQPAGTIGFPWVAGDFVFSVTTEAQVVCMSKLTGEVVWIQKLREFEKERKREDRISWTGPVLVGGRLITFSSLGRMVVLNPETGEQIEERKIGDPIYISAAVANETLYVLTDDAKLIALR